MSDSEYSSDEDDEDYVPEVESGSEEDDPAGQEETVTSKSKTQKKKQVNKRKRKGGIKLEDEESENEEEDESQSDEEDDTETEEKIRKRQEEEEKANKARMEDLWASFKSDTASVRLKPSNTSTSTKAAPSKSASTNPKIADSDKGPKPSNTPGKSPENKVTITKIFDFAGEAVTVTKTVDANSAEAKSSSKQQETSTNSPIGVNFRGTKRPGGLGSVLGQLGKKPKISTLEKSKLDWDSFKKESGIADELRNFNKNGYLEKQDFLQRTDQRLFEREKKTREAMRKQQ